jgi:hypothetical protein
MEWILTENYDNDDLEKWDFDESEYRDTGTGTGVYITYKKTDNFGNNYKYKLLKTRAAPRDKLYKLERLRHKIYDLCKCLKRYKEQIDCDYYTSTVIDLFLSLHDAGSPSLLSEIPRDTKFDGLNKPKSRYRMSNIPFIGKDANERALYRDIFLNLEKTDSELELLLIHELAHSMANHVRYRPDDHHADFKYCENLIKQCWNW